MALSAGVIAGKPAARPESSGLVYGQAQAGGGTLLLETVLGPPLSPIELRPGETVTLGRLPECDVQLPESEKTVSRKHCTFSSVSGMGAGGGGVNASGGGGVVWHITDVGSRHGTFVNNTQLAHNAPHPIRPGDSIRLGPWVFRVHRTDGAALGMTTIDDRPAAGQLVTVTQLDRSAIDRRRLELLIQCAKLIQTAVDERQLAECLVEALMEGTGYPRVAIIRPAAGAGGGGGGGGGGAGAVGGGGVGTLEVLAQRAASGASPTFQFSRSLVAAACAGQTVQLRFDELAQPAMSIMSAGLTTAMAAPVFLDGAVALCFYLDARREERPVHEDAGAFCQAIAEMSSLSIANMQRTRLVVERLRLAEQMEAAMQIQRQILPSPAGNLGEVAYAMELRPGRFVAGDLFDIIRLDARRVAFFIGDVAGKGVPAAILMATTQSYLNAALRWHEDPAMAVHEVNQHLMSHAPEGKFVSLWVGVLDVTTGVLRFCDAGHGYCLIRQPGEAPGEVDPRAKGMPLRVLEEAVYASDSLVLRPGARVVLYSDGVVEQPSAAPAGARRSGASEADSAFGLSRILSTLALAENADQDVHMIVKAVQRHAGSEALADDLTVASIEYVKKG